MSLTPEERRLEKEVRKQNPDLLKGLPGEKKKQLLAVLATQIPPAGIGQMTLTKTQVTATSSPVPPAELLAGYNTAFENGGERLFAMVERQSAHRISLESQIAGGQLALSKRGQIFAFVIAIVFGGMGMVLTLKGHSAVGATIFGTTVVGLVAVFIAGQFNQKRNLDQKAPK